MGVRFVITVPAGATIVAGKDQVRAVLRAAGSEVAAKARAAIRAGGATAKRKAKRRSEAGKPPVGRSGDLARGIKVKVARDGERVIVKDVASHKGAFYALFLEQGAKGGGGDTHNKANIRLAGTRNARGQILGANRMVKSAISKTRILLPHPFMVPALDAVIANGLEDRVRDAIMSGLKFQRAPK